MALQQSMKLSSSASTSSHRQHAGPTPTARPQQCRLSHRGLRAPHRVAHIPCASMSPAASPTPSYTVSLWDAMKFNGPAPEVINGRLAMVGFINAVMHEVSTSETILQQVHTELTPLTVSVLVLWVVASLIPILKGVRNNEAFGPFSPQAEMVNGRAAMLGLVVLALLEDKAGVPFF